MISSLWEFIAATITGFIAVPLALTVIARDLGGDS